MNRLKLYIFFKIKKCYFNINKKILVTCLSVIILFSCNESSEPNNQTVLSIETHEKQSITCDEDSSISYSIYLPDEYHSKERYPVIFFFDSQARGGLPLEIFKEAAEYRNFIIAGSNNVRNGADSIEYIITMFLNDVIKKYSINQERIYFSGFSGGARIANILATTIKNIKGIISCSAGFSKNIPKQLPSLLKIMVGGSQDFNYLELLNNHFTLKKAAIEHQLLIFKGKHEWPNKGTAMDIICILEFDNMYYDELSLDRDLIEWWTQKVNYQIDSLEKSDNLVEAAQKYEMQINALKNIESIEHLQEKLANLKEQKAYNEQYKEYISFLKMENDLRQEYAKAFHTKKADWWQIEISELKERIANETNVRRKNMAQRLLSYLGILAYSFSNNSLANSDMVNLNRLLAIYEIVAPENPDQRYFSACLQHIKGNDEQAIKLIKAAIDLQIDDVNKIKNSPYLTKLSQKKEFQELF